MQPPDRSLPLPGRLAAVLRDALAGAADRRPAGTGIRFADADRLHGRNSASGIPGAGLVIVGAGSLEESLRAHIASKPIATRLLYGDMPHAVTLRATLECDVLLRTTLYDGDSVSVREALYIGTPVIATDNGMRPAGVHLIPASDPERLRDAVCRTAFARSGAKGRRAGDGQENIRAVVEFYEEVLRARR